MTLNPKGRSNRMHFGIFIVFFFLSKKEQISIKVSKYLKVPYAGNFLYLLRMRCEPYKNTFDGLYCVKSYDARTYFYSKNDLIIYERKLNHEVAIFIRETIKDSYKVVWLSKLEGIIRDEDTILISFNDHIRFVVSRDIELQDKKRYASVINVLNGEFLLMSSKDEEIYLEVLPLFHRTILPIIHVKKNGIFIHLFDLLSATNYIMEWTLNDIKNLINVAVREDNTTESYRETKEKILHDSITNIEKFDLLLADTSVADDKSKIHPEVLTFIFRIKASGEEYKYDMNRLIINIEANVDKVTGILHFNDNNAKVLVTKESPGVIIAAYSTRRDLSLLPFISSLYRTYDLNKARDTKTTEIEIKLKRDFVYDDGCYFLVRNTKGIIIKRLGEYITYTRGHYHASSIIHYKQYVFMLMTRSSGIFNLTVIDLKNDLITVFHQKEYSKLFDLTRYRILYYFYPIEKYDKLIFIHNSLMYMLILDTGKLEQVINKVKADREIRGCEDLYGQDVIDTFNMEYIGKGYYLPELIYNSIQLEMRYELSDAQLSILGHYFDSNIYKMYLIVRIVQQDVQTIGVCAWNCAEDEVRFQLVCYSNSPQTNRAIEVPSCSHKKLAKRFVSMKNIALHGPMLHSDRGDKFELLYLSNRLADLRYYRLSYKLFAWDTPLKVYRIENVILMKLFSFLLDKQEDWGDKEDSSFCFVLSRLQLVRGIRHVIV
jgi:hypothetical protein